MTNKARIYNGEKTVSVISGSGETGHSHVKRMKLEHSIYHIGEGAGDPLQYSCLENPMDGGAW